MSKNVFNDWIKLGLEKGLSDVEVYATSKTELSISVYDGKVEQNEISKMNSALIKGIYNNKAAKVKIENFDKVNVEYMIDRLIDSASNVTANEPALIFEGSKSYAKVDDKVFDFSKIDPLTKVQYLLDIEKGIKKDPHTQTVESASYSEAESKTVIVNSKGLNLSRHNTYATIYAVGVYNEGEQIKTGLSYQMVKDFNDINVEKLITENIENGVSQLGGTSVPSKKYPIVFSNEQFGSMLSVFEGIFTGEAAFRKLTKLIGKENTKIANDIVNLIDDPLFDKALFKTPFDDEGVACEKRYWIKDGVFTDFAHNLKTAEIFKTKSTGNGFTSGIGATNLYLEPQDYKLEDLFASIDEGIYLTNLSGLHAGVDTLSGDFSLQTSGFEIKNGKKGKAVDMIVVSGNFFNLLNDIEMIADDLIFGLYGVGTGSVKVKELTIAGK